MHFPDVTPSLLQPSKILTSGDVVIPFWYKSGTASRTEYSPSADSARASIIRACVGFLLPIGQLYAFRNQTIISTQVVPTAFRSIQRHAYLRLFSGAFCSLLATSKIDCRHISAQALCKREKLKRFPSVAFLAGDSPSVCYTPTPQDPLSATVVTLMPQSFGSVRIFNVGVAYSTTQLYNSYLTACTNLCTASCRG